MATPWHKNDFQPVPDEARAMEAIRPLAIPPGDYVLPHCSSHADMKKPEFVDKLTRGPVLMMTVLPNGMPSIGKSLLQWFINSLVVGVLTAYVTGRTLAAGADYMEVFRLAGTVAFIGYSVAMWQASIWYHRPWGTTFRLTVDGLAYGLVTAGAFGWLWPAA